MERRMINTLIVGDDDLDCNCETLTLDKINIGTLGFKYVDLEKFDLIVYKGKHGNKIIKTRYW